MPHSDEQLRIGSTYLRYHLKMYVETLLWIQDHLITFDDWDTNRNAILEDHLVHARILINFICSTKVRSTDVIGINYFHDFPNVFSAIEDDFLKKQADSIGGRLVHLTTKPMPKLKSEHGG